MCVCVCVCCVCVFILRPLLFRYRGGRMRGLSSACKTDRYEFTERKPFLPSHYLEESAQMHKLSAQIPKVFISVEKLM